MANSEGFNWLGSSTTGTFSSSVVDGLRVTDFDKWLCEWPLLGSGGGFGG